MKSTPNFPHLAGTAAFVALTSLSCNNVLFSSKKNSDDPVPVSSSAAAISCDVFLNDHKSTATVTVPGPNPTVTANCSPSQVTYTWSVTRNGNVVSVNGLQGAQSTPDLVTVGAGTYQISLRASAQNHSDFNNAKSPLTVTVVNPSQPTHNVSCDPKINGNSTSITLTTNSLNPEISANCNPSDASCNWTVIRGGSPVTIPGMSACTSLPDFHSQPPGTYLISLTATRAGHNTFTTNNPLSVTVPEKGSRAVTTTKLVTPQDNQLDVQLIVDNSKSMLSDNQKLASRLQGFVNDLSNAGFDWQMCTTVTNAQQLSSSDPTLYWGLSYHWVGNGGSVPYILKAGTANTYQIFQDTINQIGAGWAGTDDERAIKAAWWHLWNGDVRYKDASGCYRKDAGLATIIISDEDERSVGGDSSQEYYPGEFKPLEQDDYPKYYVDFVKEVFGATKRFAVNSIIVRPGDTTCTTQQDADGSKSHFGYKYSELATLTGGSVGSICDSDYSTQLKYFKDQVVREMASLPLECSPIGGNVQVSLDPTFTTTVRLENSTLYFDPKIPAGRTIKAQYQCPQ